MFLQNDIKISEQATSNFLFSFSYIIPYFYDRFLDNFLQKINSNTTYFPDTVPANPASNKPGKVV